MYECRNRLGERIGHAYTKQQAEEMIRHANWLLDQKRGTPEYEQRVVRAQKAEEKEMNATGVGIIAGVIFFIICIIMAQRFAAT